MNSRLVSHGQRNQLQAFLCPVIVNPINHVSVCGMASEKEEDSHIVAGPLQRVGQAGVRSANTGITRWPLDFPRSNADAGQAGTGGDVNLGQ